MPQNRHALEKMDMYGIDRKEVEMIVRKGMKWQKDGKWHAAMMCMEAVCIVQDKAVFVITVYPAGEIK